jgi:hypothetical protein
MERERIPGRASGLVSVGTAGRRLLMSMILRGLGGGGERDRDGWGGERHEQELHD